MSDAMADPGLAPRAPREDHVLDPNFEEEKFEFIYRQLANVMLQLYRLQFDRIGSLLQDKKGHISVSGRPLIQGTPDTLLSASSNSDSKSWYAALAEMPITQFTFQHNDSTLDEDDARDEFVARLFIRQLVSDDRLTSTVDNQSTRQSDPRLFSEDFRPSNILVDKDLRIASVID